MGHRFLPGGALFTGRPRAWTVLLALLMTIPISLVSTVAARPSIGAPTLSTPPGPGGATALASPAPLPQPPRPTGDSGPNALAPPIPAPGGPRAVSHAMAPVAAAPRPPPGQPVGIVRVGSSPEGVAYDPFHGYVYVTNPVSNTVSVLNGTALVKTISVGSYPSAAVYDSVHHFVYVVNYYSDNISIVNGTAIVATIQKVSSSTSAGPYAAVFDTSSGVLYVAEYAASTVALINNTRVVGNVSVSSGPDALAYDSATGDIYVACGLAAKVTVIRGSSVTTTVNVGTQPEGIAFASSSGLVYAVNYGTNTVSVIDASNRVAATVGVGSGPLGAAYDPGNGYIYVADYGAGDLTVINGTAAVATVAAGTQPFGAAYDTANGCLYVTLQGQNSVLILSTLLVESPVLATPLGNPADTADKGQAVVFNTTVWLLTPATLSGSGSATPAVGLGCGAVSFSMTGSVGGAQWRCQPTNASTYTVALSVRGLASITVTSSVTFTVFDAPTAAAPFVNIGLKSGLTMADVTQVVNFTESAIGGTGTFTSYLWETFPIGVCQQTSTGHPVCVFPTEYPAPLQIKVVVTDSNGATARSPTITLQVNPLPSAGTPTVDRTTADVGQAVDFSTSATGGSGSLSYSWLGLPAGCLGASGASPRCVPTSATSLSVSVAVTDDVGGASPRSPAVSVAVSPDPAVRSVTVTPTTVTVGNPLVVNAIIDGGWGNYTLNWSGLPPGCSGHNALLSCRPSTPGTYRFSLNVTDQNGFRARSTAASVKVVPQVSVGPSNPSGTNPLVFGMPPLVFYGLVGALAAAVVGVGAALILRSRNPEPRLAPEPERPLSRAPEPRRPNAASIGPGRRAR